MWMSKNFPRGGRKSTAHLLALIALVATIVVLGPSGGAAAQAGAVPFDCDGTPYIMQNSRMYQVVPDPANPGQFLFEEVGIAADYGNSLGYDPTTNLVYGIRKIAGAWTVLTYDGTWATVNSQPVVEAPGSPTYPSNGSSYAGTVIGDGQYIIATYNAAVPGSTNDNLWSIDAATGLATWIGPISPQNPRLADFAYNPADGFMYHVAGDVIQLNPLTGEKIRVGDAPGLGGGFGSSYFDSAGNLYVHRNNDGHLFKVSGVGTGTNTVDLVAVTPSVRGSDAASCVGEIDLLKDVVDDAGDPVPLDERIYAPGDIVNYEFTIINNALPAGPQALTLCDTLPGPPADGRTYTGNVSSATTISSSTLVAGGTDFCLEVVAPSSLWANPASPGGDPVTVIVEVEIGADMLPGEYDNQATLENPFDPGDLVSSDDPGDVSDPEDPTTIQVTGEFTVTKAVATHPDGNATDAFTVVIECIDAENNEFDVDPSSIVDAAGTPWTGAGFNTFPITDGQAVRVIDLPKDSTCTAVESPVPTAYALTATSTDTTVADGGQIVVDERPSEEAVALTNETGQFSLTKFTVPPAVIAAPLDLTGSFDITVACSLNGTQVLPPTVYAVNAATPSGPGATGTLSYPDTPLLPHGAACTATETVPPGWNGPTAPVNFTIDLASPAEAQFTNERLVEPLTITKSIEGLPEGTDTSAIEFEVNVTCIGGFAAPSETFGPFTLTTAASVDVLDLPVGSSCTVVETPVQEYSPVYSPAGGVATIEVGGSPVGITNVTGTFIVRKDTVVSEALYPVDPTGDFTVTIVCIDGDGLEIHNMQHTIEVTNTAPAAGASGGLTYEDGSLPLLPPGTTCTITEDVPTGWALIPPNDIEITIPADGVRPTAVLTNERILADLIITKDVIGTPPGVDEAALSFDVTVECTGPFTGPVERSGTISEASPFVLPDLPVGATCTAVETAASGFVTTVAPATSQASITDDTDQVIAFTNETTWFDITKNTVVPAGVPVEDDATFSIAVVCTNGGAEVLNTSFLLTTIDGTASLPPADIPLLPAGSECTATETVPAGWTVAENDLQVTTSSTPGEIVFTNTRDTGSLQVTKAVEGLPPGASASDYSFVADIVCTGDFATAENPSTQFTLANQTLTTAGLTINDLPTGANCNVAEQAADGFSVSYPDSQAGVIDADVLAVVPVLNTTSSFTISKTTSVPAGVVADAVFTFSWVCDDVLATTGSTVLATSNGTGSATFINNALPLLPPGTTCEITEAPINGWTATQPVASITTGANPPVDAPFVNTRQVGAIEITKSIVGLPSGADPATPFTVTVECTSADFVTGTRTVVGTVSTTSTMTVNDLPTDAQCTVTEADDPAWTPLYDPVGGVLTIAEGDNDVSIVNSTGELIVFKENFVTSTHPIVPTEDFVFTIECSQGGTVVFPAQDFVLSADSVTASGGAVGGIGYEDLGTSFAPGTSCTITEQTPPNGWQILSDNPAFVDITADGGETAEFRNGRLTADLRIEKSIEGLPSGVDPSSFTFNIEVVCTSPDLDPSPYTISGLTVTPGTPTIIEDLPTGALCTATETPDPRFATTLPPAPTVVEVDGEMLSIVNTTRTLTVEKTATAAGTFPIALSETFDFDVVCGNGYTTSVSITTDAAGTGTVTYPTIELLADGTACTVTELTPPTNWSLDGSEDVVVTLTADGTAAFTNVRATAPLAITKSIVGLPADVTPPAFTVDLVCSGGFASAESPSTQFTINDVALTTAGTTVDDLPVGTSCVVSEDPSNAFIPSFPDGDTRTVNIDADPVAIVNETSTFEIEKTIVAPAGIETGVDFDFSWQCNDPALSSGTATITGAGMFTDSAVLPIVPVGTECEVTETSAPAGWSTPTPTITVATATGGPVTASFENTRETGDLQITKEIQGFPTPFSPDLDDELFAITVTCIGDFASSPASFSRSISVNTPATILDLPTGADCSVVEDPDDRFFVLYNPTSTTIATGTNALGVINVTGELMVQKNTIINSDHPISPLGDFDVQITCTNAAGTTYFDEVRTVIVDTTVGNNGTGAISYDDLPLFSNGTVCTVAEVNVPTGWTETTDPAPGPITIDSTQRQTAVFENTRDLADLTVTKRIEGLPADLDPADFAFEVSVTCNGADLPTNYAIAPFMITPGTDVVIEGLPTGATCTAAETADPRFTPTFPAAPTPIVTGGATLPIVNTTTSFSITKTATTTSDLPIELAASFGFEIVCGNESPVNITIDTANNGLGSADHNNSIPLVAPGTLCTVTETPPANWTETSTILPFTTADGTTPVLEFVNERDVATLNVDKLIVGLPAPLNQPDFTFDITVSCTGGFTSLSDPYQVTAQITTASPYQLAGVPAGAECTVTEQLPADSPFVSSVSPASSAVTLPAADRVTFTNSTSTFAISKTTVVPAGAEDDATFDFAWSCSDTAASSGTASITTNGGQGDFLFSDGLAIVPPGTVCSVDETALPTGWVVTESPIDVTTQAGTPAVAAFENTRTAANLEITKSILGLGDDDGAPESFTFLIDIVCTGDFPGGSATFRDQPIRTDAPITIPNLPTGAVCTATEQLDPSAPFAAIYGPEAPAGGAGQATITDAGGGISVTNLTGRVAWVKQTVAAPEHPVDPVETFNFTVTCQTAGGATYTFPNGTTQLTVPVTTSTVTAAGAVGIPSEADLPLLPAGLVCQVTEDPTAVNGWMLTSSPNPVEITISPTPNPGEFTNTRDAADLTINKLIQGLPASLDPADFTFEVTVTCSHADLVPSTGYTVGPLAIRTDMPVTIANLPTGADCTVVETADEDFTTTYVNEQIVIADGATSTITNSTGALTISKMAEAPGALGIDLAHTFTFDLDCDSGDSADGVTITTTADGVGSITYPDLDLLLPEGASCTVTERTDGDWIADASSVSTTIVAGQAAAAFTNTRKTETLDVTKVLEGAPPGAGLDDFLFDLTVDCTGDFTTGNYSAATPQVSVNAPYALENLPTGAECTVAEIADPRFSTSYDPDPPIVTIVESVGASVEITNSTGELIVAKTTIVPANRPVDPTGTFMFQIDCAQPGGGTVFSGLRSMNIDPATSTATGATGGIRYDTLPLMPDGTICDVTEVSIPSEWELTSPATVQVTINSTAPETADFENTRRVETLRITKELDGLPNGALGQFDDEQFSVTVDCTGDFVDGGYEYIDVVSVNTALEIDNLPTGAVCTITEADDGRFTPSYLPQVVTIGEAGALSAITNTTGELVLMKETVIPSTHPIDPSEAFEFQLVCVAPGATVPTIDIVRSVTPGTTTQSGAIGGIRYDEIPLLADGTECTVTEIGPPADWTLTFSSPMPLVIDSQAPITASFVNTHDVGDLEVTKTTLGLPAEIAASSLSFDVRATCNHPNLVADYPIDFTITGDGTHLIEALPANAVCVVTETSDSRFDTRYSPISAEVTIVKDDVVTVDITNETSYFELEKTVVVPGNAEINLIDNFTFTVACTNGFSETFVLTTNAAGVARATHLDGLPLLPPTASCTIAEPAADLPNGWIFQTPETGETTLDPAFDDRGTVTFVNQRQETELTVTKTIEGLPASIPETAPSFPVVVTCTGDFVGATTQQYTGAISVGSNFVVPNLPTDASCTVVEGAAPAYATSTVPATGTTIVPLGGATVDVTNATATFEITKNTQFTSALPVDADATFTFSYECTDANDTVLASGMTQITTAGQTGSSDFDTAAPNSLPQLPHGTICVVTEQPLIHWTQADPTPVTLTLDSAEVQTAAFVNDRDTADLTIRKELVGVPPAIDLSSEPFEVLIECTGDFTGGAYSEVITVTDLDNFILENVPTGSTCTVTETADDRFSTTYSPANATVTVEPGAEVEITNTTSTFAITKETIAPEGVTNDATFSFVWSCNDPAGSNGTATITTVDGAGSFNFDAAGPLLAPGTICNVFETDLPAGWVAETTPLQVTTTAAAIASADFVNTREAAALTITKTVLGLPDGDLPTNYNFKVDVTCTGDFPGGSLVAEGLDIVAGTPLVIPDLPTGADCTVIEQPDTRFAPVYGPASGNVVIGGDGAGVSIANLTGKVEFVKQTIVATTAIDPVATFMFDVRCVNPANGQVLFEATVPVTTSELTAAGAIGIPDADAFPLLAMNTECTVTEIGPPAGWALAPTSTNPAITIISDQPTPAVFENVREVATLRVTKVIEGLPASIPTTQPSFPVTVTCTGSFVDGAVQEYSGVIADGTDFTVPDLPTDAVCTVVEAPNADYLTTLNPASGSTTVPLTGAVVEVTNATATFRITKQTQTSSPLPIALDETFTFGYVCSDDSGAVLAAGTTSITTVNGVGSVDFDSAAPNNLPQLPHGTTCVVTEQPLADWNTIGLAEKTLTLDSGEVKTAAFTNEPDLGTLEITKRFVGLPDAVDGDSLEFVVDVACTGEFASPGGSDVYTTTVPISTAGPTVVGALPVGTSCVVTEQPDSRFATSYLPASGSVVITGESSVEVINTTSTFGITKTTVVAPGLEDDAVFGFEWSCNDVLQSEGTATIATTDGEGTFIFDEAGPLLAPGTVCTVDETALPAGWTATATPLQVTTAAETVNTADFENTRSAANLTITKTVLGLPDGDVPANYSFRVDVTCTGDFPGGTLVLKNLVLNPGTPIVVPNLPTGALCSVVEQPDDRFAVVYGPASGTVTIDDDGEGVSVANLTGEVSFVKQTVVATSDIDPVETFEFAVECVEPESGDVLFAGTVPVTTNTLTAAGAIGVPDQSGLRLLAVGTVCTITELGPPPGWTLASTSPNPAAVTVSTTPAPAVFDNVRDVADLQITKTIAGLPAGEIAAAYSFDVAISCQHPDLPQPSLELGPLQIRTNQPINIGNLPTGAVCTVTEAPDARFTTTYDNQTVTITDQGAAVGITNSTGVLTIEKFTVAPGILPIDLQGQFSFDVQCSNGLTDSVIVNTDGSGVGTVSYPTLGLIAEGSSCQVTETPLTPGWTPVSPTATTAITNGSGTAAVTNARATADLTVRKLLDGVPSSIDLTSTQFGLTVSCTGDFVGGSYSEITSVTSASPYVLADVPTGAQCTVTETPDSRFMVSYSPSSQTVVDTDVEIEITNTTSTFGITKATTAAEGVDANATFTFEWVCGALSGMATIVTVDGGGSWTFDDGLPLLPPGTTCVVDETNLPAGWTVEASPLTIQTEAGAPTPASFENVRSVGDLTVSKTILGLGPDDAAQESFEFLVDIECVGQFADGTTLSFIGEPIRTNLPITVPDLPTGTVCTVTEQPTTQFQTTYSPASPSVTITDSGAAVAITNLTGQVGLVKQAVVSGPHNLDPVSTFLFDIECSQGANVVLRLDDVAITTAEVNAAGAVGAADPDLFGQLAEGTVCQITEVDPGDGWSVVDGPVRTITISSDEPETAIFENRRDVADLTISKQIVGLPLGQTPASYLFEVTVECSHPDLPEDPYTIGPLSLQTTQPTVVASLPTGAVCTVDETDTPEFATSYDNATVEIRDNGATVEITNTTGVLTVTKQAQAPGSLPINLADTFGFDISCSNGYTTTVEITTDDTGFGTIGFPTIELIADGTDCSVTESSVPAGWTAATPTVAATVANGSATTAFVNTRDTSTLTVTKQVEGAPSSVDLGDERFDITITCVGDFATGTFTETASVAETDAFVLTDIPTGASCTVVEDIDERFATTYSPVSGQVSVGSDPAEIAITNSTSWFDISKTTTSASGLDVDANGTFVFDYRCSLGNNTVAAGQAAITTVDRVGTSTHPELPLLPSGTTCIVQEQPAALFSPLGETELSHQLLSNEPATFAFTNDRNLGSLEISKTVVGLPGAIDAASLEFQIDVRCAGGFEPGADYESLGLTITTDQPVVIDELPEGATCLVTERDDRGFTPSYAPTSAAGGAVVTIDAGPNAASIVNATGEIMLIKQTSAPTTHPIDTTGDFEFAVICTSSSGVTVYDEVLTVSAATTTAAGSVGTLGYDALPLLAEATTCAIEEINVPTGWEATDPGPKSVTITSNGADADTVTFANERLTGSLILTNTLIGLPAGAATDDYSFTLTLSCTGPGFPNGYEFSVEVNHGESVRIDDLPLGSICSVIQVGDTRFAPQVPTGPFVITAGSAAQVDVVNRTGTIDITKVASTRAGSQISTLIETFTFEIECANGHTSSHTVTTDVNGQGATAWPDLPLVAAGQSCTITEQPIEGWTATSGSTVSVVITTGESQRAAFTNEYQLGSAPIVRRPNTPADTSTGAPGTSPPATTGPVAPRPAEPSTQPLAYTGNESGALASLALLFLGLGFAALGTGRRRRNDAS